MTAQNKWRNGGIINPLFDGLTYNTNGHFAHCSSVHVQLLFTTQLAKYLSVLYVKPLNKVYVHTTPQECLRRYKEQSLKITHLYLHTEIPSSRCTYSICTCTIHVYQIKQKRITCRISVVAKCWLPAKFNGSKSGDHQLDFWLVIAW